jgi:hypothetical protein
MAQGFRYLQTQAPEMPDADYERGIFMVSLPKVLD